MAKLSDPQLEELEAIRQRFAAKIPEKVQAIEQTARLLRSGGGAEPEVVERLFQLAHGLAGSAAIFGFKDLAQAAAALEVLVTSRSDDPVASASWSRRIASAVRRIRRSAGR